MEIAQDHKRALDDDEGLNYRRHGHCDTPVSHLSREVVREAIDKIVRPMAAAMVAEGCPFTGILYAGCMATARGVKTIEYNVRFGDPETEVLMIALQDDLYEICTQVLKHQENAAALVIGTSPGRRSGQPGLSGKLDQRHADPESGNGKRNGVPHGNRGKGRSTGYCRGPRLVCRRPEADAEGRHRLRRMPRSQKSTATRCFIVTISAPGDWRD